MKRAWFLPLLLCGCVPASPSQISPSPKLGQSADITLIARANAVEVFRIRDGETTCYLAASVYTSSASGAGISCK